MTLIFITFALGLYVGWLCRQWFARSESNKLQQMINESRHLSMEIQHSMQRHREVTSQMNQLKVEIEQMMLENHATESDPGARWIN